MFVTYCNPDKLKQSIDVVMAIYDDTGRRITETVFTIDDQYIAHFYNNFESTMNSLFDLFLDEIGSYNKLPC